MRKISLLVGMMLLLTVFGSFMFVGHVGATTINVPGDKTTIQDAINASTNGDTILVADGYYPLNLNVNKSVTIRSANGYASTWINGTINITANDVTIGGAADTGFTVYQATTSTSGINAINISTNGSSTTVNISFCDIVGGYNGIQIGGGAGTSTKQALDIDIESNYIRDTGASAIRAKNVWFNDSYIYANQISNTSNTITAAAILLDGSYNNDIITNSIHDTITQGGEGINITGLNHPCDDTTLQYNVIWNVYGYSPIMIRSTGTSEYVQNMGIFWNDLTNNSHEYSEPAIRFDNISGKITATNVSAFYNKMFTSSRDIEEQFDLSGSYSNWTGIMPAYFNWYGSAVAGTFRNASHLYATPYLLSSNAYADALASGTLIITGAQSNQYLNDTAVADINISSITTTDNVVIIVYPYSKTLLTTYPQRSMHKYIEVGVSDTDHITFPVNITIYYNTTDLATRGWAEKYIHGLVFYNESASEWQQFNKTGKNTTNLWGGYLGYVWGVAYTPSQLTGVLLGIDYVTIPAEGGTTPGETPPGGTTPGGATPVPSNIILDNLGWVVLLIAIAIIVIILAVLIANPKLRKKWLW